MFTELSFRTNNPLVPMIDTFESTSNIVIPFPTSAIKLSIVILILLLFVTFLEPYEIAYKRLWIDHLPYMFLSNERW